MYEDRRGIWGPAGRRHVGLLADCSRALNNMESGESASDAQDAPTVTGDKDGQKNENNVIGGHKATLNNPRVGEEAKEHSKQVRA